MENVTITSFTSDILRKDFQYRSIHKTKNEKANSLLYQQNALLGYALMLKGHSQFQTLQFAKELKEGIVV